MNSVIPGDSKPVRSWALNTLAVLGIFYTLYLARVLFLPFAIAILLALLLAPVVDWMQRWRVPRVAGALITVFSLAGGGALASALLAQPAAQWARKAPELTSQIEFKLYPVTSKVRQVSKAAQDVQKLVQSADSGGNRVVALQGFSLKDLVLKQVQALTLGIMVTLFLLYFLLASGDRVWRHTLRALPNVRTRRRMVVMAGRLQTEVSYYLFTITVINTVMGLLVIALTAAFGLPNPALWGALAGVLNFIPYLGPTLIVVILGTVAALSLPSLHVAVLVPLLFLVMTGIEGQLVTPSILGRRLGLNPVFIFASLIFWGWLWGIPGALLAVPIMASVKIVCDRIESLSSLGAVLGH